MKSSTKVIFFGMNTMYSIVPLLALNEQFDVQAVFMRNNETFYSKLKSGVKKITGYRSTGPFSLEKCCKVYGIPLYSVKSVNNTQSLSVMKELMPDILCMAGFDEKIGKELIALPPYGVLNAHTSLLPDYKGANPFFWMIKNDDLKTGCTVHRVNEAFDAGPVLEKEPVTVYEGSGLFIYNAAAAGVAGRLLCRAVNRIASGDYRTDENPPSSFNSRNPGEKDLVITPSFKVKQALWFFNAFSDAYEIRVQNNESLQRCIGLSCKSFHGCREMKLSDGSIYIETR